MAHLNSWEDKLLQKNRALPGFSYLETHTQQRASIPALTVSGTPGPGPLRPEVTATSFSPERRPAAPFLGHRPALLASRSGQQVFAGQSSGKVICPENLSPV